MCTAATHPKAPRGRGDTVPHSIAQQHAAYASHYNTTAPPSPGRQQACGNRFFENLPRGEAPIVVGRGREGRDCPRDDQDYATARQSQALPPEKPNAQPRPKKRRHACTTHPNCSSRSSVSSVVTVARSISPRTDVGVRQNRKHRRVGVGSLVEVTR